MVRIAIVIPYASMASLAQEVFQEHTAQMRLQQRDSTDYSLEIIVAPTTQELLPQMPDCDAMIVRGATYLDLCRNALSVPVIELIINGTDIVNMLLQLRQKYDYAQPFTKESLLYREIFEKYYPGQAKMIPGFWMPNKEWEGCDVNDPSARVLSNYGDSGK